MPVISLQDTRSVADILDTSNYRFRLGQVPGSGGSNQLEILCNQATYPGITNELFPMAFTGGHELSYRGRKVFPKQLSLQYAETVKMVVTRVFGQWHNYLSDTNTGESQGYKVDYAMDGPQLITYDLVGAVTDIVTFFGLQPADKPDVSYDPSSAQPYLIQITLNYDFYYSTLYGPSSNVAGFGAGFAAATNGLGTGGIAALGGGGAP
jgi:hypothetical protein